MEKNFPLKNCRPQTEPQSQITHFHFEGDNRLK